MASDTPHNGPPAPEPQAGTAPPLSADELVVPAGSPATLELFDRLRQLLGVAASGTVKETNLSTEVATHTAQLTSVERRLDAVGGQLETAARELSSIAAEMLRASLPLGACGEPWAACTHCLGSELVGCSAASWCPSCGRPGGQPDAGDAYLCTDRATVSLRDSAGAELARCLSHAAAALENLPGLALVQADEEEVQALISVLHTPLRINTPTNQASHSFTVPEQSR